MWLELDRVSASESPRQESVIRHRDRPYEPTGSPSQLSGNQESGRALLARGEGMLLVTEIYSTREEAISLGRWTNPTSAGKCPVLRMKDKKSAVFTHVAKQMQHYHRQATEIHALLDVR